MSSVSLWLFDRNQWSAVLEKVWGGRPPAGVADYDGYAAQIEWIADQARQRGYEVIKLPLTAGQMLEGLAKLRQENTPPGRGAVLAAVSRTVQVLGLKVDARSIAWVLVRDNLAIDEDAKLGVLLKDDSVGSAWLGPLRGQSESEHDGTEGGAREAIQRELDRHAPREPG
jgi:hypothetical protein